MFVGHLMMTPVNCRPFSRTTLQCCSARPGQDSSQPTRRHKATMRKQAMISNPNRKSGCQVETEEKDRLIGRGQNQRPSKPNACSATTRKLWVQLRLGSFAEVSRVSCRNGNQNILIERTQNRSPKVILFDPNRGSVRRALFGVQPARLSNWPSIETAT